MWASQTCGLSLVANNFSNKALTCKLADYASTAESQAGLSDYFNFAEPVSHGNRCLLIAVVNEDYSFSD